MGLGNARQQNIQSNQNTKFGSNDTKMSGIVYEVILDEENDFIPEVEVNEQTTRLVGAIRFRLTNDTSANIGKLQTAYPKNLNFKTLPLKNEMVTITTGAVGNFFYERSGTELTPNINSDKAAIKSTFGTDSKAKTKSSSTYQSVGSTGIARSNSDSSNDTDGYGDYFEFDEFVHKLKLYEGDSYIESRFGQSIRFSGYNNPENELNPTITIRNGENAESRQKEPSTTTIEDINKDGNIIFLGSGEYLLPYTLPTDNSHQSFSTYPSELKGNQIVLNSDRIILSAKAAEMIFSAKKDVGFITDGLFSIDSTKGIDVTLDGDTNYKTNDRNINLNTGNGKVNIGDQNLESLVRGETLVKLMSELIDALTSQIYITPSGPTAKGPINIATFTKIKSELNTIKSNLNKTS
jgi:hypothetical protein